MINQSTFDFLTALKQNNNRDWFLNHKDEYDAARENVTAFTADVLKELSRHDPFVDATTEAKKCVMRIYRDVRFSKDKTPCKNHFGIHKLSAGKYAGGIGYYLHIEPNQSFIAGGYWQPEGDHLKAIRQEIDYNAADLKAIVDSPVFKKLFGGFREQEQLKTIPSGYDAANENIDLLKLKSFVAVHNLKDSELRKKDIASHVADVLKEIYPLQKFLHHALT